MDTDTLMLRNIPPRLKGKIVRRVEKAGTNMNDVVVAILAERYEVEFQPTGVKRLAIGHSAQALLTMPFKLKSLIAEDAHEQRDSMQNIVLRILCEEFAVPFTPTGRWVSRKVAAAT